MPTRLNPTVSPARAAAFDALRELERPGGGGPPLDEALGAIRDRRRLSPADWRLCYQIAQGVTRHRIFLDSVLAGFLRSGAGKTPQAVRIALRMAVFQYLFLDRIPNHAIVNETVEIVAAAKLPKGMRGLANAVARRIVRMDRERTLALPAEASRAEVLTRFSIPDWIGREIEAAYGREALRWECEALTNPAALDLRINTLKGDVETIRRQVVEEVNAVLGGGTDAEGSLLSKGTMDRTDPTDWTGRADASEEMGAGIGGPLAISRTPGPFAPMPCFSPVAIRLAVGLDVGRLAVFREGLVTPQDEAAQLVSYWMGAKPGMRIADFCAAPGGKTTHLAAMMENEGTIWALDADPWRLAHVEEAAERLGIRCIQLALNTEETRGQWTAPGATSLDAALVDPPCTNLGTLRRHPDVKWRHRPGDVRAMARKQLRILEEAARCVRPGGVIVYSVCSFTYTETVETIDAFLKRHREWARDGEFVPPSFVPAEWRTPSGDWLTRTGRDGIDGFFVARLRKR